MGLAHKLVTDYGLTPEQAAEVARSFEARQPGGPRPTRTFEGGARPSAQEMAMRPGLAAAFNTPYTEDNDRDPDAPNVVDYRKITAPNVVNYATLPHKKEMTPEQAAVKLRSKFKTQEEADLFAMQFLGSQPKNKLTPEQARIKLQHSFKNRAEERAFGADKLKADPHVNMITGKPLPAIDAAELDRLLNEGK